MTRKYGIPVETFRTPKRPPFSDRVIGFSPLWPTVFVRAALCEIAASAELVCHGPVGHLLIPGIALLCRGRKYGRRAYSLSVLAPGLLRSQLWANGENRQ